jgi:hypothetical protein
MTISDVLDDAADEIRGYLSDDPPFPGWQASQFSEDIHGLLSAMDDIRHQLDAGFYPTLSPSEQAQELLAVLSGADEYDQWQGVISIDVELALRATSGRPNHTDPEEQGIGLASAIRTYLVGMLSYGGDSDIGEVTMTGHQPRDWMDWNDLLG